MYLYTESGWLTHQRPAEITEIRNIKSGEQFILFFFNIQSIRRVIQIWETQC